MSSFLRENNRLSNFRSLIKGISYRFFGTLDTIIISWIVSRNPLIALKIGFTEVTTKIILFYLHERLWRKIPYGRMKQNPVVVEQNKS